MAEAVAIAAHGGVPPVPAGVTVNERGSQPQPQPQPQPVQQPAAQPTFDPSLFQQPATQPAAPAAPATDPALLALLGALTKQEQGNQPASPAPAPQQPAQAPVAGSDPVVNSLQGILSAGGVDVQAALAVALEYGDARLIDKTAFAKSPHLVQVAEALVQHRTATMAAIEGEVYQRFGGEANFDAALSHFGATAQPFMKDAIKKALDSGDRGLIMQAADYVMQSVQGGGVQMQKAGLVQAGAAGAYGNGSPLSKEQFKAELMKLDKSAPGFEDARNELFYRRQMGKNQGR